MVSRSSPRHTDLLDTPDTSDDPSHLNPLPVELFDACHPYAKDSAHKVPTSALISGSW